MQKVVFLPIDPTGKWWVEGVGETVQSAFTNVEVREGFISWKACEALGWKVAAARVELIGNMS